MCSFSVSTVVTWTDDGRQYRITAVHSGSDKPCTYDLALASDDSMTQTNVPEGHLRVDI